MALDLKKMRNINQHVLYNEHEACSRVDEQHVRIQCSYRYDAKQSRDTYQRRMSLLHMPVVILPSTEPPS